MMEEKGLIAPCGMNCKVCGSYLRKKNPCSGCHGEYTGSNVTHRHKCVIRNCDVIKLSESGFCFECLKYPCRRLRELNTRYRTDFDMSMIENLEFIRVNGLHAFVVKEHERWRCLKCGGVVCVHTRCCSVCGMENQ